MQKYSVAVNALKLQHGQIREVVPSEKLPTLDHNTRPLSLQSLQSQHQFSQHLDLHLLTKHSQQSVNANVTLTIGCVSGSRLPSAGS